MRNELHLMELVDRYLDGAMNARDRAAYEQRLRTNDELRSLMEDQQKLREAARRVPVRAAAKKAYRKYRWGKWAGGGMAGAVILIVATAAIFLWSANGNGFFGGSSEASNAAFAVLSDTTGMHLHPFILTVDPKKDTTVITPNGIVLDIPKGTFVDDQGRAITKPVCVTLLEALDPLDIMKAGLSTMSGDTLLETGGMFCIDAQVNGRSVKIDPAKPLTAMVPANEDSHGMMLYQGVMGDDGIVDWRNPKPLKRSLVPEDITTLNFYPPGYEAKLAGLGYEVTNKTFKDSLYYSFGVTNGPVNPNDTSFAWRIEYPFLQISTKGGCSTSYLYPGDTVLVRSGINPSWIKAIWNPRFNNTNLATKAFEERMRAIHGTSDIAVLNAYVNRLDKDLSSVDSQVVAMGNPEFEQFAERSDGRVDLPAHAAARLRRAYEHWSQAEAEAVRRTQEHFWKGQSKLDNASCQRQNERVVQEVQRNAQRFYDEYEINLKSVCAQLGIRKFGPRREPPITAYVTNITNPGWWNVDRAVFQATADRKSINHTDSKTGKSATLTYTPFTVDVADRTSYEDIKVYLLPKQLNSFQRLQETNGAFTEKLNSIFDYDLVCLGIKDGKQQAFARNDVKGLPSVTATLQPVDDNGLRQLLRSRGLSVENGLLDEARFMNWLQVDRRRTKANQAMVDLMKALLPVVFPCAGYGSDSTRVSAEN